MGPALNDPEKFESLMEWYRAGGRVTSVHGAFIDVNPGSGDKKMRALSCERSVESCRAAESLGAENVVFHCACFPFLREGYLDFWAGQCAEFYEELADTFALNIFIENSVDIDPGPLRELMRRISNKRIGVCLDIGHVNYSRTPLELWVEELHEWIGYLHLSDNNGVYDSHLALGQGTIDGEAADRIWRDLGTAMPVTIETKNEQLTVQSLEFLKEHHFFQAVGGGHAEAEQ